MYANSHSTLTRMQESAVPWFPAVQEKKNNLFPFLPWPPLTRCLIFGYRNISNPTKSKTCRFPFTTIWKTPSRQISTFHTAFSKKYKTYAERHNKSIRDNSLYLQFSTTIFRNSIIFKIDL